MRCTSRCLLVALVTCSVAGSALAELVVIYDSGRTRPIIEFTAPLIRKQRPPMRPAATPAGPGIAEPANLLPIRSAGLSPGPVEDRDHAFAFAQAFFDIGSDVDSQRWLQGHRQQLLELGATGLLVQAESIEDLETIAEIAAGLSITPASGSDIAKALAVTHYPFAISAGRIWQ